MRGASLKKVHTFESRGRLRGESSVSTWSQCQGGRTDGWMDEQTDGRTDGRHRTISSKLSEPNLLTPIPIFQSLSPARSGLSRARDIACLVKRRGLDERNVNEFVVNDDNDRCGDARGRARRATRIRKFSGQSCCT